MDRAMDLYRVARAVVFPASALTLIAVPGAMAEAGSAGLAPHRAVYDMRLGDTSEQSGIAGVAGRMVYEFTGSACEGYSVNFRFVTEFQDTEGGSQITDLQTTSFEATEAESYQFLSKTFVDQQLVEETRGTVTAGSVGKTVELLKPAERSLDIGGEVLFPTEHMIKVLKSAKEGAHFLAADIYDGAETGDKVFGTTTVIGARRTPDTSDNADAEAVRKNLESLAYWPVTVAYFDPSSGEEGELTPVYQLSFWLYENGISGNLTLDYGDFTIKGEMIDLEMHETDDCPT